MVGGDVENMHIQVFCFINEVLRLGWPQQYVANALASLPRRHQSDFARAARYVGRTLRKHHFSIAVNIYELQAEVERCPLLLGMFKCMAPMSHQRPNDRVRSNRTNFPMTRFVFQMLPWNPSKIDRNLSQSLPSCAPKCTCLAI